MKRSFFLLLPAFTFLFWVRTFPVAAQTDLPPEDDAAGVVLGKIVNQNKGNAVTESLDVMLHIWDQQFVELGMEHGKSEPDGTFKFNKEKFSRRIWAIFLGC